MSGPRLEAFLSKSFHSSGIPLLVSPKLLRMRNLGQIDLARMQRKNGEWLLEIAEVKSSNVGILSMQHSQRSRLYSSLDFLGKLFGCAAKLTTFPH